MRASMWLMVVAGAVAYGGEPAITEDFPLKSCRFTPWEGNQYFPLKPGRQLYYTNAALDHYRGSDPAHFDRVGQAPPAGSRARGGRA